MASASSSTPSLIKILPVSSPPATPAPVLIQSYARQQAPSPPIALKVQQQNQRQPQQALPLKNLTADVQDKKPWKYQGYPGLTKFMSSSSDAFVLRRFNKLNTRVVLAMQDEIYVLEKKLERCDQKSMFGVEAIERNSSIRQQNDALRERHKILRELRPLLKEYNDYILSYSELRSRSTAQDYQVRNVQNWFHNNPHAIDEDEQEFANTGEDLISIVPRCKSWLRLGIERISPKILSRVFSSRKRPGRVENEQSFYASSKKINAAETFVIMVLGLAILLGPLWWLDAEATATADYRLYIISGFVVFFTISLASATVEQPFQVLIGAAGYAAVLMVFMQQQNSP